MLIFICHDEGRVATIRDERFAELFVSGGNGAAAEIDIRRSRNQFARLAGTDEQR